MDKIAVLLGEIVRAETVRGDLTEPHHELAREWQKGYLSGLRFALELEALDLRDEHTHAPIV